MALDLLGKGGAFEQILYVSACFLRNGGQCTHLWTAFRLVEVGMLDYHVHLQHGHMMMFLRVFWWWIAIAGQQFIGVINVGFAISGCRARRS